ncbi:MAG: class beta-lactamase [Myxococcales bacterium]|nr:class beta-lactamase [Myxococcales bacterium]
MKLAFVLTFVLLNLQSGKREVINAEHAKVRTAPCSTFKIPHALIGLETGVLSGADHPMKWDGIQRDRAEWNRDQTLRSAIEFSTVWYFQALAQKLGRDREKEWLTKIPYGNADVSAPLDRFWFPSGSLRISVDEQVDFVKRLYLDTLPFARRNQAIVRDCLVRARGPHGVFSGKTGSGGQLGWFVGHVTHDGAAYVFATRLEEPGTDGPKAKARTEQLLRERGLWIE